MIHILIKKGEFGHREMHVGEDRVNRKMVIQAKERGLELCLQAQPSEGTNP